MLCPMRVGTCYMSRFKTGGQSMCMQTRTSGGVNIHRFIDRVTFWGHPILMPAFGIQLKLEVNRRRLVGALTIVGGWQLTELLFGSRFNNSQPVHFLNFGQNTGWGLTISSWYTFAILSENMSSRS